LLSTAFLKALEHQTCGECYLQNTGQECNCGEFKYIKGYSKEEKNCCPHARGGADQTEWEYGSRLAGHKLDIKGSSSGARIAKP